MTAPETLENTSAEAELLGSVLINNRLIDRVADIVHADDFADALHGRLFAAAVNLSSQGKAATPVTLAPYFADDADFQLEGGGAYLMALTGNCSQLAPVETAQQIAFLAERRRANAGLLTAADACADLDATMDEIIAHVDAALGSDTSGSIVSLSAGEAIGAFLADHDQQISGVATGSIPSLDDLLGPMRPGQLIIAAGRPGMGKTTLAVSAANGAARRGHGVLFVSLEMSAKEIAGRALSDICCRGDDPIPYEQIRDNRLSPERRRRVIKAQSEALALPFQIIDAGSLTVSRLNTMVRRQARRMEARGQKLELVIVDYLQLLRSDQKGRSNYENVSEVSRSLKAIAKDHGVAVLALAQLSREVEKREGKRPLMSDLRDSGQIEQDADAILLLLRDEYYLRQSEPGIFDEGRATWEAAMEVSKGALELILAKRRNGKTGSAVVRFSETYQAVRA